MWFHSGMQVGPTSPASASQLRQIAGLPSGEAAPQEPVDGVASPQRDEAEARQDLIDTIKRRSTLIGLVEPAAIFGSLALNGSETIHTVGDAASSLFHGDFGGAATEVQTLVGNAYHPNGVLGGVYKVGVGAQAVTGAVVGGLEIRQGIKTKDHFQTMMGAADLVGASSIAAVALGNPTVGMGLGIACSAAKVGMVLYKPERYTRIQKVDTTFGALGAVTNGMMKAGVAVVPALIAGAILGPTQMLYMNNDKFRAKADKAIDWVVEHLPHRKGHEASESEPQALIAPKALPSAGMNPATT